MIWTGRAACAALLCVLALGCKGAPPPAPPTPAAPPPEPAPPPPPPKCESLEEKCVSTAETRVAIEGTPWTVAPPEGWTYARLPTGVASTSSASMLALEARGVADKKKPPPVEALASIVTTLGVTFPKRKGKLAWPRRPDKTMTVRSLTVRLYQLDGATREAKTGPLLVFTTTLPDGPLLVGAGFVPDDDASNADAAIMKSIESLAAGEGK
jgi:hypothetical protein